MADFYQITISAFPDDVGSSIKESETRDLQSIRNDTRFNAKGLNEQRKRRQDAANSFFNGAETVVLHASPTLSESRTADYVDQGLPSPVGIVIYRLTQNRRFNIGARFVSTTTAMAEETYRSTNLLRSWMLPFKPVSGDASDASSSNIESNSGRPPLLRLNGYLQQFFNIPVVLSELSINFPEDVDYIETKNAMVPIIQTVDMTFIEAHGRAKQQLDSVADVSDRFNAAFDIEKFKNGNLPGF